MRVTSKMYKNKNKVNFYLKNLMNDWEYYHEITCLGIL